MQNITLTITFLLFTFITYAQEAIRYFVNLDNVAHHEIEVTVEFPAVPQGVFTVRMPGSSPGRYAPHAFAKNIYGEKAFDGQGKPLQIHKSDISEWQIAGHNGAVKLEYTVYANHADGTYAGFDNKKAMMNMPSVFIYGVEMDQRPIELTFDLSKHKDWKVATQLKPLENNTFWSPDYYYFYDSPTIIGDLKIRTWQSESNGKNYTIEIAMLHEGTDKELDDYTEWVKKVVEEEKKVYGGLPDFDFGKYTFLCAYNPYVFGDGMEHRNSTMCNSRGSLADNADGLIGTIAHEFFHCWNVERIRPRTLEPFDFYKANMSGELWFAEGFTNYYDDLSLCRAGILADTSYVQGLAGILNAVMNSPAREYRNVIQMSQHAPFVDAAVSIDENNYANTFISYYTYGSFVGISLDLNIRNRYAGKSLDDVMRYMWEHFGKTEIPYEIPDIQKAVTTVTGDAKFATEFFNRYVYASEVPNMQALFGDMGVTVRPKNAGKVDFANLRLDYKEDGAVVNTTVLKNTSLYSAGLNRGDKIVSLNGQAITNAATWDAAIEKIKVGSSVTISFVQNGISENAKFLAKEDPTMEMMLQKKPSDAALKRQKAWLKK